MSSLSLQNDTVRTLIWTVFFGYVLLLLYATTTGSDWAYLALDVIFVLVMFGFAYFILYRHGTDRRPMIAATALIAAGAAQAVARLTDDPGMELLSFLFLVLGVGVYVYLRRSE